MKKSILTILAPATNRSFVDLATIKSELGITAPSFDSNLTRWLKQASSQIESYCNRVLVQETVSEQFRLQHNMNWPFRYNLNAGFGDSSYTAPISAGRIALKRYPVTALASVTVDGTVYDPSEYEVDPDTGLLQRLATDGCPTTWTGNVIVVQYTGGYTVPPATSPTIPGDIQDALIELAKMKKARSTRDPLMKSLNVVGVRETQYWVGSIADGTGPFPQEVAATLDPYIDRRV